jgi:hypothetical protein
MEELVLIHVRTLTESIGGQKQPVLLVLISQGDERYMCAEN